MSSVSRSSRQVPLSTTYYAITQGMLNTGADAYELVTSSSNYVGNYPGNGDYVVVSSAGSLATAIANGIIFATNTGATPVLRDMGKTIYARVGSASSGTFGWFRQVQLLAVGPSTGFLGGAGGSNFGVLGDNNNPDQYTNFLTFYIPVVVAGVLGATTTGLFAPIAGGQM